MRIHPDHRHFMLGSATSVAALSMPAVLRANTPLDTLTFFGAPAGPSITLAYAVAQGAFSDIAGNFAFKAWRDPDELRAGLTSGTMKIVIMPSNAAANLYNRGLGVHMVNAMTLGLNSIMTKDPEIKTSADLKGRSITFPFRNDTPDILLRRVLAATDVQENSLKIVNAAPPYRGGAAFCCPGAQRRQSCPSPLPPWRRCARCKPVKRSTAPSTFRTNGARPQVLAPLCRRPVWP